MNTLTKEIEQKYLCWGECHRPLSPLQRSFQVVHQDHNCNRGKTLGRLNAAHIQLASYGIKNDGRSPNPAT